VNTAETLNEFSGRCLSAIDRIGRAGGRRIAVIAHGGVLECIYRAATRTSISSTRDFPLLNASINRLLWTDGDLRIVSWSDIAHLDHRVTNSTIFTP
jgi:probable phosphoglycerate mutase